MPLSSDPMKLPYQRGWEVLAAFNNPKFGPAFTSTLEALSQDCEAAGFSDVGIRNMLFTFILSLKPEAVLEVGSHIGTASVVMGQALRLNNFGKLYSIEPIEQFYRKAKTYVEKAELGDFVEILNGFSYQQNILQLLKEKAPFEIAFIDACHNYADVKKDIEIVWSLLGDNGIVFFHDSSLQAQDLDTTKTGGVRRALLEAKESIPGFNLTLFEYPLWLNPVGGAMACKQKITR